MDNSKSKLSACALALSIGILWGISMFLLGIISMLCDGWASGFINLFAEVYIGYSATFFGAIIGGLWGFVDGLIGGALLAWLYNFILVHCKCPSCCSKRSSTDAS